jgi:DNA modification methylase
MSVINQESGENWTLFHGDCCEVLKDIPENSIDFCIHSPPFANLYIYSDSESDMGNAENDEQFYVLSTVKTCQSMRMSGVQLD